MTKRRKRPDPDQAAADEEAFRARVEASRRDLAAMRQRVWAEVQADIERKYNARKDD